MLIAIIKIYMKVLYSYFKKTVESVQVEFNHAHLLLDSLATFDFKTAE